MTQQTQKEERTRKSMAKLQADDSATRLKKERNYALVTVTNIDQYYHS